MDVQITGVVVVVGNFVVLLQFIGSGRENNRIGIGRIIVGEIDRAAQAAIVVGDIRASGKGSDGIEEGVNRYGDFGRASNAAASQKEHGQGDEAE